MKKMGVWMALYVTLIGIWVSPLIAQDVTLRYRWKKGEETVYRLTQEAAGTLSGPIQMSTGQKITQTMRQVVEDVAADGSATIRQTVEAVQFESTAPVKIDYDSTTGQAPTGAARTFAALVGQPITVVISPDGSIQKMDGAKAIVDKMAGTLPASGPAGLNPSSVFTEDTIKSMAMQGRAIFPDHPVKIGDSWERELATNVGGMALTVSEKLTLQKIEGNVAHIQRIMSIKAGTASSIGPMSVQVADGSGTGEMLIDLATGQTLRSTSEMKIPMTMSMARPNGAPMAMSMTQTTSTTMVRIEQ